MGKKTNSNKTPLLKINTESSIIQLLHEKYSKTARYKVGNIYAFNWNSETDFFVLLEKTRYCYDIEVKISRADYFHDFKKEQKHYILQHGEHKGKKHSFRPNKFYYCVPEGLIKLEEIPQYAGLMYVINDKVHTIKEAPFIHKEKFNFEEKLCQKFYWYWKTAEVNLSRLKEKVEELENKLKNNTKTGLN